ncbi:TPA: prolipoprotein diacylglyceryl transferase [Candidatus Woesearchaeota archaeon]|nr:prolipoprotein diacylglyceryl transferase [Candidatus Woesearchaeota archaeon]
MFDLHYAPENWGVRPTLFSLFGIDVPSYGFFVALGLIVGGLWYWHEARKEKQANENTFLIGVAAIIGGAFGAKLLELIINPAYVIAHFTDPEALLSGRTIIGGLLGGWLAVRAAKHWLGIEGRRGNLFAPAVALGVTVGRIGCFFRGCCYGTPTSMPWGVDFGDGIARHPTMIYEALFTFGLFLYLLHRKRGHPAPGALFTEFLNGYFTFRFFVEFIRVEPQFWGLSVFQWISLAALAFINWQSIRRLFSPRNKSDKANYIRRKIGQKRR